MGAKENAIQRPIIEYLLLKGVYGGRTNNAPVFDKTRGAFRRKPKYAIDGLPDFLGWARPHTLPRGGFIAVEVKTPKGTTSRAQKKTLEAIAAAGQTAILARSLQDVVDVLGRKPSVFVDPSGVYVPSGKWRLRND